MTHLIISCSLARSEMTTIPSSLYIHPHVSHSSPSYLMCTLSCDWFVINIFTSNPLSPPLLLLPSPSISISSSSSVQLACSLSPSLSVSLSTHISLCSLLSRFTLHSDISTYLCVRRDNCSHFILCTLLFGHDIFLAVVFFRRACYHDINLFIQEIKEKNGNSSSS